MSSSSSWPGLERLGFPPFDAPELHPALPLGRVVRVERGRHLVVTVTEAGERWCTVAGSRELDAGVAVGDWVQVRGEQQTVRVLPRKSWLGRKSVKGTSHPQLIATNLDRALIVTAVGPDLSPRRIERYVALVRAGGAEPVVVLNKTDLPYDKDRTHRRLSAAAPGAPLCAVSATSGALGDLEPLLQPRHTLALVGSSGVGKTSLVNALLGQARFETQAVRERDDKGRHTTTRRALVALPSGALLIDTPGLREVGLLSDLGAVATTFVEISDLAEGCRFSDCCHEHEPGCAVRAALEAGELPRERWESHRKLLREAAYEAERAEAGRAYDTKDRWKRIHQEMRARRKRDPKLR